MAQAYVGGKEVTPHSVSGMWAQVWRSRVQAAAQAEGQGLLRYISGEAGTWDLKLPFQVGLWEVLGFYC